MNLSEHMEVAKHAIARERARQISVKGWSQEHDRDQGQEPLLKAARAYVASDITLWPWSHRFWKPTTTIRNLVKGGALAQAAIEASPNAGSYADETRSAERLYNRAVLELGKLLLDAEEIMDNEMEAANG